MFIDAVRSSRVRIRIPLGFGFENAVSVVGVWSGGELSQRLVVVVSCGGCVLQLRLALLARLRTLTHSTLSPLCSWCVGCLFRLPVHVCAVAVTNKLVLVPQSQVVVSSVGVDGGLVDGLLCMFCLRARCE